MDEFSNEESSKDCLTESVLLQREIGFVPSSPAFPHFSFPLWARGGCQQHQIHLVQ